MLFICIGNSSLFFSEKMFQVVLLLMCGVFAFFSLLFLNLGALLMLLK